MMSSELEDVFGSMMVGRVSFEIIIANFFGHDTVIAELRRPEGPPSGAP